MIFDPFQMWSMGEIIQSRWFLTVVIVSAAVLTVGIFMLSTTGGLVGLGVGVGSFAGGFLVGRWR